MSYYAKRIEPAIGGLPVISLGRDRQGDRAQLLDVEILPGRGMNVYQLRAFLPGLGIVPMFTSPALEEAARLMNGGPEDYLGNQSFTVGGALLIPYANRIGGIVSADGRTVTVQMLGKNVALPANWKDTALHGLVLDKQFGDIRTNAAEDRASASAAWKAGDFGGHWPSRTDLAVEASLAANVFSLTATARNTGAEPEPMSVGWHPYFAFPSGDRRQARLRIPARRRALVNNYDDMAATGETVPVEHTPYDFSAPGGTALADTFLDECFLDLDRNSAGEVVAEILDPAARYGVRLVGASPEIQALQVYAPAQTNFVAIEPQFNLLDPFSGNWPANVNTGMVTLEPGQAVSYRVRLELFTPEQAR
jgi:aldose 1-epimerase